MADEGIVLSPETFDRFDQGVRRADALTRAVGQVGQRVGHGGPGTDMIVRIAGCPVVVRGVPVYPGRFCWENVGDSSTPVEDRWFDGERCEVMGLNDERLIYGARYSGRITDFNEENLLPRIRVTSVVEAAPVDRPAIPDEPTLCPGGAAREFDLIVPAVDPLVRDTWNGVVGDWSLKYRGSATWRYSSISPWVLTHEPGNWVLTGYGDPDTNEVVFKCPDASFDCCTGGTFTDPVRSGTGQPWDSAVSTLKLEWNGPACAKCPDCSRQLFPVRIKSVVDGTPNSYTFAEGTVDAEGTPEDESGGRNNTGDGDPPAFAFDEDEAFEVGDPALARWNATCDAYELIGSGGGSSGGSSSCVKYTALESTDCLSLSVVSAGGRCGSVDTAQRVILDDLDEDGVWVSQTDFVTDTGEWTLYRDWPACDPAPRLRAFPSGGGSGGTPVCFRPLPCVNGRERYCASGTDFCGNVPTGVCGDNTVVVELDCVCCPNPDYDGPGWYCRSTTGCGAEDVQTCVYYDEDPCVGVVLCSGPYSTREECDGACNEVPVIIFDCGDGAGEQSVKGTLAATCTAASGDLACMLGAAVPLVWDGSKWTGTVSTGCGCDMLFNLTRCDGLMAMSLQPGGGGGVSVAYTNPPFHAAHTFHLTAGQSWPCGTFPGITVSGPSSLTWEITE